MPNAKTSTILSDDKSLSAILQVGVDAAKDLNPHAIVGPSDGDSFYIVSYLESQGHLFTALFHLILLNKPPGPLALWDISILDEAAGHQVHYCSEDPDMGQTRTLVSRTGLDVRIFTQDRLEMSGYLFGTMDALSVGGHATDSEHGAVIDCSLKMTALGPTFNYLAAGMIPFPGGIDYEYAFPSMATQGSLTISGKSYNVNGTSWLDREWGHFGPAQWTWISIQPDSGIQMAVWDEQPYDFNPNSPHVGGRAFATVLGTDGDLTVTTAIVQESGFQPSKDGKHIYASTWVVALPGNPNLTVTTVAPGQEIPSSLIPRLEAKCSVSGKYKGTDLAGAKAFVEVGNIPPI